MAALWNLPVLFCCENNLYAMGTALERAQSQTDLTVKAASYRVPTLAVDGMDVEACHAAAQQGVDHVRDTGGPFFIEFRTYRFRAHSMFDPELYRDKAEVERWRERDPIRAFTEKCLGDGTLSDGRRACRSKTRPPPRSRTRWRSPRPERGRTWRISNVTC